MKQFAMVLMLKEDLYRLYILKQALETVEEKYNKNPLDAQNLTTWGATLLAYSQLEHLHESESMAIIRDAISKVFKAIMVTPKKHETLWCLGGAYQSIALASPDELEVKDSFDKAEYFFKQAVDEDPSNDLYIKSLEDFKMARNLLDLFTNSNFLKELELAIIGKPNTATSEDNFDYLLHGDTCQIEEIEDNFITDSPYAKNSYKKQNDLKYDVMGWLILGVAVAALAVFSKPQATLQAARYFKH